MNQKLSGTMISYDIMVLVKIPLPPCQAGESKKKA